MAASTPYAEAITRAVSAVASFSDVDHPLTGSVPATEQDGVDDGPPRAALLLLTSDRGLAGAYSSNAIKEGERLSNLLRENDKEVVPFLVGRKGVGFYRFRNREMAGEWTGFSESPTYADAKEVADAVIDAFLTPNTEGGVDEIHIVFTHLPAPAGGGERDGGRAGGGLPAGGADARPRPPGTPALGDGVRFLATVEPLDGPGAGGRAGRGGDGGGRGAEPAGAGGAAALGGRGGRPGAVGGAAGAPDAADGGAPGPDQRLGRLGGAGGGAPGRPDRRPGCGRAPARRPPPPCARYPAPDRGGGAVQVERRASSVERPVPGARHETQDRSQERQMAAPAFSPPFRLSLPAPG